MAMLGIIFSKSSEIAPDGAQPWSRASFPSRAVSIIADPTYADAIFEILAHNAHRLKQPGKSLHRLAQVATT